MGHLSIDFRQREIRLLETEGSAKSLKVKHFRILDTMQEGADMLEDESLFKTIGDTLGKVLSSGRFTRDPTGMSLGSSYCIFRDIELPFKSEEQIRKVIKFEVENTIQSDIDDIVVSFFKKTESLDKSFLMVLGAKKNVLAKQLGLLQSRDVDPYFIDLDLLCMYNALAATGYLKELNRFLLVNVSTATTHILVLENGRLITARSVPLGVGGMRRALEHDLKMARIDPKEGVEAILGITPLGDLVVPATEEKEEDKETQDETKELFEKPLDSMSKEAKEMAGQRRTDFLTKLRREILRTLTFVEMQDTPERILVTGVGCRVPGLEDLLVGLFDAPVEELDLLSRVNHTIPDALIPSVNREICAPLGVAYKTAGLDMTRVDFRQEEVRYAKKFDQVKVPLACLVFLVLILVVLLNLEQFMLRKARRSDMTRITALASKRLMTALGDVDESEKIINRYEWGFPRILGVRNAIEGKKRQLGDLLGREGTIPELPSVFPIWHDFFQWIDNRQNDFTFFKLNALHIKMAQKRPAFDFDCEVATGSDESLLVSRLIEDIPIFTEIRPGKFVPNVKSGKRVCTGSQVTIDLSKKRTGK